MKSVLFTFITAFILSVYGYGQNCEIIGPDNPCTNQQTTYYGFCLDADGYQWFVNGNYAGGDYSMDYTFITPGYYQITLYYSIGGMFIADPTDKFVSVTDGPIIPVIQASPTVICDNSNVTLTVTNPEIGISYSWTSSPAGYNATGNPVTFNNVSATTTFYVTASNGQCSRQSQIGVSVLKTVIQPVLDPHIGYRKRILRGSSAASDRYWQTSSSGTEVVKNLIGDYTVTQEGNYFIRARSIAGNCWTTATGPVYATMNHTPPLAVIEQIKRAGYNEIVLMNEDKLHVLNFADYYWVKDTGVDPEIIGQFIVNNQIKVSKLYVDGIHYLKGRDRSTNTWGPTLTFSVQFRGDNGMNWVNSKTFNGDSHGVISETRSYFDDAGKPLQTQTKNFTENYIFATQTLKDKFDRPVGSTLPAPILPKYFNYNSGFVLNTDKGEYAYPDFDDPATKFNPDPVDNEIQGTLGWYYSENNTIEPNIGKSNFPYGRVDYYDDGIGNIRLNSSPGDQHRFGMGHEVFSANFPVINELNDYLEKRRLTNLTDNQTDNSLKNEGIQQLVRDENGKYSVALKDKNGNTVMTASPGAPGTGNHILQVDNQVVASGDTWAQNYQPEVYFYLTHSQPVDIVRNLGERVGNGTVTGDIIERSGVASTEKTFIASQYIKLLPGVHVGDGFTARIGPDEVSLFRVENLVTGQQLGPNQTFADGTGNWPAGFYKIVIFSGEVSFSFTNYYKDISYQFYNEAGRLLSSVSPNGYKAWVEGAHYSLIDKTFYKYNYRGLLIRLEEPDGGITRYIYRKDGSIRFSMNAVQAAWTHGQFSYTNYDPLGRPIESGEYKVIFDIPLEDKLIFGSDKMKSIIENTNPDGGLSGGEKLDWTKTSYDLPDPNFSTETGISSGFSQSYVRGAVSFTENENTKTWYSYDELSRAVWVIQKPKALSTTGENRVFVLEYEYDFTTLLSVTHSELMNGQLVTGSRLIHHFEYDAGKRLTRVLTSTDGSDKKLRATYHYYLHGPLKRVELGDGVQGVDYVYNIHGWLTQINDPNNSNDPGGDGGNGIHEDVFGMILDYYESNMTDLFQGSATAQYNGVIASARWSTEEAYGTGQGKFSGMYSYTYDEKYQVKEATWANPNFSLNTFTTAGDKYRVSNMAYDANGNILSLRRYDLAGLMTNDFSYGYVDNKNQLINVTGYSSSSNTFGQGFKYNALGQLTNQDLLTADGDQNITYDVTGKVRKVYGSTTSGSLKVEYLYDDRGFRLAKKNIATGRTTWYIRDASGSIVSIYEGDNNSRDVSPTELPLFGSGKLGTYYPQQDGSVAYELTDHLGNVRALVRDNVTEYTATIEDNETVELTNPRVQELAYFQNLFETEVTDSRMNHSPPVPGVVDIPNKAAYLYWVGGMSGMEAVDKSVGPAIALKVNANDTIRAEAWVRFENKVSYTRNIGLLALSTFLGTSYANVGGFEGLTPTQTGQTFEGALTSAGFMSDGSDNTRPFAYINFIIFDENRGYISGGWQRITEDAGFYPGEEGLTGQHVRVAFNNPIVIPQAADGGYVYVWVSNESEGTKVWFDDVKVTHSQIIVTQATDYGVWGDVLREMKSDEIMYRFAYQGQFAERDEETGWSHFEAREYDYNIGRWVVTDPSRQHWSPYLAMGNNSISNVDPDGEFVGTIIGGLIGAGVAAWRGENVWKGAVTGAVAGAVFDLVVASGGTALPVLIAAGAASGASGNLVDQVWDIAAGDQNSFDFVEFGGSTLIGGAAGLLGPVGGRFIGPIGGKMFRYFFPKSGHVYANQLLKRATKNSTDVERIWENEISKQIEKLHGLQRLRDNLWQRMIQGERNAAKLLREVNQFIEQQQKMVDDLLDSFFKVD